MSDERKLVRISTAIPSHVRDSIEVLRKHFGCRTIGEVIARCCVQRHLRGERKSERNAKIVAAYNEHRDVSRIVKEFGLSKQYTWQILYNAGVSPSVAKISPEARLSRNAAIVDLYKQGATLAAAGAPFKLTRERVRQILRANGCEPRRGIMDQLAEQIKEEYESGMRVEDIAAKYDKSVGQILSSVSRAGIRRKVRAVRRSGNAHLAHLVLAAYSPEKTGKQIAAEVGCNLLYAYRVLNSAGLKTRGRKK